MREYLCQLKNKFGYNEELLDFLSKLITCLIDYYGEEYSSIIFDALLNCEIHFQSKVEDSKTFLNNYFNVNREWNIPFSAGAFYRSEIYLNNNQLSSKSIIYIITGAPEFYFPFNFNNDDHIDKLIHEILHLIKGYKKLKTEEGYIIESSGLVKFYHSYDLENGITCKKIENNGIEEALNCVEASEILEMMTGRKQEIRGYKEAGELAKFLLENNELLQAIRRSQFSFDDSWIQFLGEEKSKILIENFEFLVRAKFASFKILNTPEKIKLFNQDKQNAKDAINEILNNSFSKKN